MSWLSSNSVLWAHFAVAVADPEVRAPYKYWSTVFFKIQFYIRMRQNKAQIPCEGI